MGFEMPKQIIKETNPETSVNFFDVDKVDAVDENKIKLRDLSDGEIDKMQKENPGLYEELAEKKIKDLEETINKQIIEQEEIDYTDKINKLYERTPSDYRLGQN